MKDPMAKEIRQARDAHTKQLNHDLDAIYEDLRRREKHSAVPTVTLPPRHLVTRGEAPRECTRHHPISLCTSLRDRWYGVAPWRSWI